MPSTCIDRRGLLVAMLASPLVATSAREAVAQGSEQPIYGSQLMTERERQQYRDRLRLAGTEEERQRIRAEHHEQMRERAHARGMELPEEPPARGQGQRRGGGQGTGGQGGGGRR